MSQTQLLKDRRFLPLFATQFLGAFNDNLFKNAMIVLLAYTTSILPSSVTSSVAISISAGLFILPFFIFSAVAGEIADKSEKSLLIKRLKIFEVVIIAFGMTGFYFSNIYILWITLFLLGIQATFFGPIKYSILPQHLKNTELTGGNALIESATFVAILLGTILGGYLMSIHNGINILGIFAISVALLGYVTSSFIPVAPKVDFTPFKFNYWQSFHETLITAKQSKTILLSILGISWFWFLGATLLSQIPTIVKSLINGNENVATLFMAIFSLGIGVGSILCEKLSGRKIEIGLVPFGAVGLSLFAFDLYSQLSIFKADELLDIPHFLSISTGQHIVIDLLFMSIFGGFYIVPLYALIQSRSNPESRSRMIAANNILNAGFMVLSAIYSALIMSFGFDIKTLILSIAILNTAISVYIFSLVPEFIMRFITWMLIHTVYRINKVNMDKIPEYGAAVIVCNHVSFMDAVMIFGCIDRPVKFVMYYKIFNIPFFRFMFNAVGAIPIAGRNEDETVFNQAFDKINQYLTDGEIVVIFPEGKITSDGQLNEFKPGLLKILERNPVDVYPSALSGLWGSMYSRKDKSIFRYFPKAFFTHKVTYIIGDKINATDVKMDNLQENVKHLRGDDL